MIEKLISEIKESLAGDFMKESSLTPDQAEKGVSLAGEAVTEGIKSEAMSGNLDGILNLFKGKDKPTEGNPIIQSIISGFAGKLTSQLGLGGSKAGSLASMAIPMIMNVLSKKFLASGASGDLSGITKFLGMEDAGSLLDKLPGGLGKKLGGLFGR